MVIRRKKVEDGEIIYSDYIVSYNGEEINKIEKKGDYKKYNNGDIVYFDPEKYQLCNESDAVSLNTTKTGCMKWFIFNDDYSDKVNMILDHNTTALVMWNSTNRAYNGMRQVVEALMEDTKNWHDALTLNETIDGFNYSGYKARLITAEEVAQITNNRDFITSQKDYYYLENNLTTRGELAKGSSKYAWLIDYMYKCETNGCNQNDNSKYSFSETGTSSIFGYWTSTPATYDDRFAWYVSSDGRLARDYVFRDNMMGIRPVITMSKNILK